MTIFLDDRKQLERQMWISCLLGFICNFCLSLSALSNFSCQQQGEYNIIKLNGNLEWKARRMFSKNTKNIISALPHGILVFVCPSGSTATGSTGQFFQAKLKFHSSSWFYGKQQLARGEKPLLMGRQIIHPWARLWGWWLVTPWVTGNAQDFPAKYLNIVWGAPKYSIGVYLNIAL